MNLCTSEKEYIKSIAPSVRKCCKRYGYLPSVLIAQSCLENGYGIESYFDNPQIESLLKYNNMVGIKSELLSDSWYKYTVWPGESLTKDTPEVYDGKHVTITDNFRKYDNIEQSFADFLIFLKYASNNGAGGTPKYGDKVLGIKDPAKLIKKVSSLGYATDPEYAASVLRIINKHDLEDYDNLTGVIETKYYPGYFEKQKAPETTKKTYKINDIVSENLDEVPASRGSNSINFIVIHYLGVPNADNPYLYGGGYGGHYYISRKGEIYKAANPKTAVTWHCGGGLQGDGDHPFFRICTNYNSIGIECGVGYTDTSVKDADGDSKKWYFTTETQEALLYLVSSLMDEYNISFDHVIRHYDVTSKICPAPYVHNNKCRTSWTWDEFKDRLKAYREPDDPNTKWYRVRRTKSDEKTQRGAFKTLDKAIECANENPGYSVYDYNFKRIYKAPECMFEGVDYTPVYNYSYYKKKYADLEAAFGTDKLMYFKHFIDHGMVEGRQASSSFKVSKYKKKYPDLEAEFGEDLPRYYKHYCKFGKSEGRSGK